MHRVFRWGFIGFTLQILACQGWAQEILRYEICPRVFVEGSVRVRLTDSEKILACPGVGRPPYQQVPWNQQQYFLSNFFNARGFFQFKMERLDDGQVHIKLGPRSVIRQIRVFNTPISIRPERYWQVYGRPMTSEALNQVEKWVRGVLSRHGYPCIELETKAFPLADEILINVGSPQFVQFPNVEMELIPGTIGGVERRYNAFEEGQIFNSMLLELTTKRMIADELVISANYIVDCKAMADEGIQVKLNNIAGKPRLINFGLGFDTEEYFIIEGQWKNSRFGEMASSLEARVRASFREQQAFMGFNWFYAPFVIRHSINSQISYQRQYEANFESSEFDFKSGPAWTWDQSPNSYQLWLPINYKHIETIRGVGPNVAQALSFNLNLSLMSHKYEYYLVAPREGYTLNLNLQRASKTFGSDYSMSQIDLSGAYLWNLFKLDPAVWILGVRSNLSTIFLEKDTETEDFPTNKRLRLGGSNNLRGFGRNKIPGEGALTTAYIGSELRISQVLPYDLQPILFVDAGRFGMDAVELTPTTFWAPGFGVHWQSIIGTIRASLAYGFVSGEEEGFAHLKRWQAYLSYGEYF